MLKLQRRKFAFVMPSGIDAEVQSLCGANQADLTQSELPFEERLNRALADVIVSVEGYDNWNDMKASQRIEAVKKMLDADRKSLLVAARYCSMRTNVFELKYEWTESSGVKQEKRIELGMLGESNIAESIDTIAERWGIERDLVMRVNYIGGMATKPYKKQFEKYPIERGELDYDVEVSGVTFRLQLLTAQAQPKGLQEKDIDAHTSLMMRNPRYMGENGTWYSLTRTDINGMDIMMLDALPTAIYENEGLVDSVATFQHPNGLGKEVTVDALGEVAFFFPSGRI